MIPERPQMAWPVHPNAEATRDGRLTIWREPGRIVCTWTGDERRLRRPLRGMALAGIAALPVAPLLVDTCIGDKLWNARLRQTPRGFW